MTEETGLDLDESGVTREAITAESAKPLRLEWLDPADLADNPANWREHPAAQTQALKALIDDEVGWAGALLYNEQTGRLIDGHARKKVGAGGLVPVLVGSWDEATEAKILATLDPLAALARSNKAQVQKLIANVQTGSSAIQELLDGVKSGALAEFAATGAKPDGPDPDIAPEPPEEPICRSGDLWLLGEHRVLCGDTFAETDRTRLLMGCVVDLVLTDPPYAIYGSSTGIGTDIADDKMVRPFFEQLARACAANIKEFGHVYWCCDWRSWAAIWESIRRGGLTAKNCLIWDKGNAGLGSSYANTYEMVGFFAKLPKQKAMTSAAKTGQRVVHRPNVYRCPRVQGEERQHNAAKPVELMEEIITNSSDPDELVWDPFLGSGTTLIACERLGRRCVGMEMEPKYVDVTVKRWEKLTGRAATRHPAGEVEA